MTPRQRAERILHIVRAAGDDEGLLAALEGEIRDAVLESRADEASMERVQQAQKLESLGVLAGGIAHDFNNLLVSMLGNADLALAELPADATPRRHMERVKAAAMRASDLTNQLLAYSGKGRFVVEPIKLDRLVAEMRELLQVSVTKKVDLRWALDPGTHWIEADASQVRQVVVNLVTNASEAFSEGEGTVIVETTSYDVEDDDLEEGGWLADVLPSGPYAFLRVTDTGPGMDPETRERIFDPFYSTKFAGRGLGLAVVLGIVRGHHGAVRVLSRQGHGTVVEVLLPSIDEVEERAAPVAEGQPDTERAALVLVVDDEPAILDVAQAMLEHGGYRVVTASDGEDGVRVFREHGEEIDVVLLDMTMPRMGGAEAYREIKDLRDDVPVVLSSGYNAEDAARRFGEHGLAGFLQKPYELRELLGVIRRALEKEA